jgi:hypothetical protein
MRTLHRVQRVFANVLTRTIPLFQFLLCFTTTADSRCDAGKWIASCDRLAYTSEKLRSITNVIDGHPASLSHLRGGSENTLSCSPPMREILAAGTRASSNCARKLYQLGAAAASWLKEFQQRPNIDPISAHPDDPSTYPLSEPPAAYAGGIGATEADSASRPAETAEAQAKYDVLLSCLPRGVAARRVQVRVPWRGAGWHAAVAPRARGASLVHRRSLC